jgi:hypothetical protein
VKFPKSSTWNSTAALIAELDICPEMSVSAELHTHVQARGEVNIYYFKDIKTSKTYFYCNVLDFHQTII